MRNVLVFLLLLLLLGLSGVSLGVNISDSFEENKEKQILEELESEIDSVQLSSISNNTSSLSANNFARNQEDIEENRLNSVNSSNFNTLINDISNDGNCSLVVYNITDEKSFVVSVDNLSENKNCKLVISNSTDGQSFRLVVTNNNTLEPLGNSALDNKVQVLSAPIPSGGAILPQSKKNEVMQPDNSTFATLQSLGETDDYIGYENLTPENLPDNGTFTTLQSLDEADKYIDYENLTPENLSDNATFTTLQNLEETDNSIDYENLTPDSQKITNSSGFNNLESAIPSIAAPVERAEDETYNLTPSVKFNKGKRLLEQTYEDELLYSDKSNPIFLALTFSLGNSIKNNINFDVGYGNFFVSFGYSLSNNTQYTFANDSVGLVEKSLGFGVHIYNPEKKIRAYTSLGVSQKDFDSHLATGILTPTGIDDEEIIVPSYTTKSYGATVSYIKVGLSYKIFDTQLVLYNRHDEDVTALNNPYANIKLGVSLFGNVF